MPIVMGGSTPNLYCTIEDVREFGIPDSYSDGQITHAIQLADIVINDYTGKVFANNGVGTWTNNDVRRPLLVLPTPFTAITDVQLDGAEFTDYIVEPWGLRLERPGYYDPDGFPRWQMFPNPIATDYSVWGVQVIVSATFGYLDIPLAVSMAAKMLACKFVTQGATPLLPDSRVKELQVEGYRLQLQNVEPSLWTTGLVEADRLLQPYRSMMALIG